MTEIKTDENAFGALDQDQTDSVSDIIYLCAMWQDLGGLSLIQ